jgi:hypothetical protein
MCWNAILPLTRVVFANLLALVRARVGLSGPDLEAIFNMGHCLSLIWDSGRAVSHKCRCLLC